MNSITPWTRTARLFEPARPCLRFVLSYVIGIVLLFVVLSGRDRGGWVLKSSWNGMDSGGEEGTFDVVQEDTFEILGVVDDVLKRAIKA